MENVTQNLWTSVATFLESLGNKEKQTPKNLSVQIRNVHVFFFFLIEV